MACAIGDHHSIILSSGEVHSFGKNNYGQLGLGHNNDVALPSRIPNLTKIKEISCGYNFTVCINRVGELWSFGRNNYGQLGTGNTTNYNIPQKIGEIPLVRSVTCGCDHTLIITNDSKLWSCGKNDFGQLCLGNKENQSKYQQTTFEDISKITAGYRHSLFQNTKGEIFGCGQNCNGEIGLDHYNNPQINPASIPNVPPEIIQFCSGCNHSLFLDAKGNVYSIGYNGKGSLGLGHNAKQKVLNQIPNIPPIRVISCVRHSSYLIDMEGNLWSFGNNCHGQLGHGDETNINVPAKIDNSLNCIVQTVQGSPSGNHFLAIDSQNKIFVVGNNDSGQLGIGNNDSIIGINYQHFRLQGNQTILNGWKQMCSEETMNWNEEDAKKLEYLQPKINQVKLNFESNKNKIKHEFPPKSFETWNNVQHFLNDKYQQIITKLNRKQETENQITQNVNKIEMN